MGCHFWMPEVNSSYCTHSSFLLTCALGSNRSWCNRHATHICQSKFLCICSCTCMSAFQINKNLNMVYTYIKKKHICNNSENVTSRVHHPKYKQRLTISYYILEQKRKIMIIFKSNPSGYLNNKGIYISHLHEQNH